MELCHIFLFAIAIACHLSYCENVTRQNSTQVIDNINCGVLNISCGLGKTCRDGVCVDIEATSPGGGREYSQPTETPYKVVTENEGLNLPRIPTTAPPKITQPSKKHHSLISGNQEFAIALVGFSLLFINFCLVTFCLGRMKRRRLERQRELNRRQAATHSSQASQTGDWDSENVSRRREALEMGFDNFALNGELDAFSSEFAMNFPQVRLPPYDFSSAYHKPRPMTEEDTGEGEPPGETNVDVQSINEDPPPYSDQRFESQSNPPSYDEALKVSTDAGASSPSL